MLLWRVQNLHHHHLSVRFTPDSYSNFHQVKSGYLKSLLTLVSGATPTDPLCPRLASYHSADSACSHLRRRHYVPACDHPADDRSLIWQYVPTRECN